MMIIIIIIIIMKTIGHIERMEMKISKRCKLPISIANVTVCDSTFRFILANQK